MTLPAVDAIQVRQDGGHFRPGQHHRQMPGTARADHVIEPRQLHPEHLTIQEEQRLQRLIPSRGTDLAVHRQMSQELLDFGSTHLPRRAATVKPDITSDPVQTGPFHPVAGMPGADLLTDRLQQSPRRIHVVQHSLRIPQIDGHRPSQIQVSA